MKRTLLTALCVFLPTGQSLAHEVEQHFMTLTLQPEGLSARLEMDAGYALPEMRSAEDDTLPTGAWLAAAPEALRGRIKVEGPRYLHQVLQFRIEGQELPLTITFGKWGTDWPDYFDQRPDTFARMVWDVSVDYAEAAGTLELFWNEGEDGPSLALQTISGERVFPLITVDQGEEHTLAAVNGRGGVGAVMTPNPIDEGSPQARHKLSEVTTGWLVAFSVLAALLLASGLNSKLRAKKRKMGET